MAMKFQPEPSPMKRITRLSTRSSGLHCGSPNTWLRKPRSAYSGAVRMPDFASRRLASTSCVLLPIEETIPIPVTTTRRIALPSRFYFKPVAS